MQKLDIRVQRRTLAHLDDMIDHFEQLEKHAKHAEFWTKQSIDVKGEGNSKAIYVFTAVTVIFLPLSFVAGLLGMNTREIRVTRDTQWLFWVVAVPVTLAVLIICLIIVKYKFMKQKGWSFRRGWQSSWRKQRKSRYTLPR